MKRDLLAIMENDLENSAGTGSLVAVKRKKTRPEKQTLGTLIGAKYRARCNTLTDSQREKLDQEFLKLYYADSARESARRR